MFDTVATGGTFDILHKGHYALLLRAFEVGKEVIIGVASDNYAILKRKKIANDYVTRVKNLKKFIKKKFNKSSYSIYELNDFYGPTIFLKDVQAIVTTEDTKGNCIKINELRRLKGMPLLEIIVVPLVEDQQGKVISSTRIRKGKIDLNGRKWNSETMLKENNLKRRTRNLG